MRSLVKSFSITVLVALIFTIVSSGTVFAATEASDKDAGDGFSVEIDGEEKPVGGWAPAELVYIEEDEQKEPEFRTFRNRINGAIDDVFVNGASDVGYNSLSSVYQQNLYRNLALQVEEFMNSETDLEPTNGVYQVASIPYTFFGLTLDEGMQVFYAYDYDHPGYYWISNTIRYSSAYIYMLTEPEYASVSARRAINRKIIDGVKEYAAIAEKGEDTLDKIAVIHDLIVNDVDYAYDGEGYPEDSKWAHSVQGVFDEHKEVVCEGYADVFSLMMNYMGIPSYYIVGTAGSGGAGGGGGHAWNAVYDESIGKYLYMDLTWDDCGDDGYFYEYFGMPKTDFETSHFKYLPTNTGTHWLYGLNGTFADSFEDTYYYRGGFYYNSGNYSDFAKKINTKAHRFGTVVSFLTSATSAAGSINRCLTGSNSYGCYPTSYKNAAYYIVINDMTAPVDLSQAVVTLAGNVYAYTGSGIEPNVETVVCNGIKLIGGLNYTVSYEDNIYTGINTAKAIVTGSTRFSGAAEKTFSISGEAISSSMVSLSAYEFEYNGNSRRPSVTVTKNGSTLTENTDYTVSYSDDTVNAGTVTVMVRGKGRYEGTVEKTYEITPASISGHIITLQNDYDLTYDGLPKTPSVTSVKKAGSASPVSVDNYDVSYENNVDAGAATVKVTGKNNYSGTASDTFTILTADISGAEMTLSKTTYEFTEGGVYEPEVTITFNGIMLEQGTDYTLSYSGNTEPGNATVTASGTGNFSGTKSAGYRIVQIKSIENASITLAFNSAVYDGSVKKPAVTVKYGGSTLGEGSEYTLSYDADLINAGTKSVTVTGKGEEYTGSKTVTYEIAPASISDHIITLQSDYDLTYDGFPKTPSVTSVKKAGSASPVSADNYDVSYKNNVYAGSATVKVTGKKNYSGTVSDTFTILTADISGAEMTLSKTKFEYTEGGVYEPEVTITFNGIMLRRGTDYTLSYSGNTEPGNATVTASGTGNFSGTKSAGYRIVQIKSIENASITLAFDSAVYDGSVKKPAVTVKYGGSTLGEGSEYTLSYDADLINAGTKSVTVTGKGEEYTGSKTVTYEITAADISSATVTVNGSGFIYSGSEFKPSVTVTLGVKTLVSGSDYTLSYSRNRNAGTAGVTASGCGNYQGSAAGSFSIAPRSVLAQDVTLEYTSVVYDGTEKKPGVTIRVNNTLLSSGTDYDTAYSNNVNAGNNTASCTVTAKGNYTGTVTRSFTIRQAVGSIRYAISAVEKSFGDAPFTNELTVIGDGRVTYSTGDASIATVDASTGEVTIKGSGTTSIKATVSNGTNYLYSLISASYVLTVNKIPASVITAPSAKNLTYTGEYQELVSPGTASGGAMRYRLGTSGSFSTSIPRVYNAGNYKVYYMASGSGNYRDSAVLGPVNVTVKKKSRSFEVVMEDHEYDGWSHTPYLRGYEGTGTVSYTYSGTDSLGNVYESQEAPVNAGSYSVTANITESTNYLAGTGSADFEISRVPLYLNLYMGSWYAGENPYDPNLYGNYGDGEVTYEYKKADEDDSEYIGTMPSASGEYTVRATVAATLNYGSGSATADFDIYENAAYIDYPPQANYLYYNGEEQDLVSPGYSSYGSMKYRLSGESDYSDNVPVGINAGEYTVYYKVEGNPPYSDSEEDYINVYIDKVWPQLYLEIGSWYEGDMPSEPVLNGDNDNGSVTYEYKGVFDPEDEYSETVPTAAGEYILRAKVEETENYYADELFAWFSIYSANENYGDDPEYGGFGNDPGNDFGNDPGNDSGNDFGNDPGNDFGNDSGDDFGNDSGNDFGNDSGNDPGNDSGNDSGNAPGNNSGNAPGNNSGNVPGNNSGNDSEDAPGNDDGMETVTVSDNKPMNFSYESKGEYNIGYAHGVPFWGKAKATAKMFGSIKVSINGIEYTASKVKVNKKKCTLQIVELSGADKETNKAIKKATGGKGGLHFTMIPYYVKDTDTVVPTIKKESLKSVKVTICGKPYKAKKDEFVYDSDSGIITFTGKNLNGSYTIQ